MDEMIPAPPNAVQVPAADVKAPPPDSSSVVHQAYPLKQPEEEINEFLVRVRGSVLRRVRRKLTGLVGPRFPWPEVLLGVSTLAAGGVLGGASSGVAWNSRAGVFFYLVLPLVTVGSGVAYGMLRRLTPESASVVAKDLLDELPDPDRTK